MMVPITEELTAALEATNAWLKKIGDDNLRDNLHVVPAAALLENLVKELLRAQSSIPVGSSVGAPGVRFEIGHVWDRTIAAVDYLNSEITPKQAQSHQWDRWTSVHADALVNTLRALHGLTMEGVMDAARADLETLRAKSLNGFLSAAYALAVTVDPSAARPEDADTV